MFLHIDAAKCRRDGFCALECPVGLITMQNNFPQAVEHAEQACIQCGHCVAVCPHGALSLKTMPVEQCPSLNEGWRLTPEQVEPFLKGRRSVRVYKKQDVECDRLTKVIDLASYAPTGVNSQTLQWHIIYDRQHVQDVVDATINWMRGMVEQQAPLAEAFGMAGLVQAREGGYDPICRNAPHLIVVHAPKQDPLAPVSAPLALTYLELAALPFGLGTCWAGFVEIAASMSPAVTQSLGVPEGHASLGVMMIGYPQFAYHRIPLRKSPRITWDAPATDNEG